MPVSVLLCEGVDGGPDIRLLRLLLPRPIVGEVRASGGKEGFRNLVTNLRRAEGHPGVCGVVDGDFPRKPLEWSPSPACREWRVRADGAETMLGWMWRRKEIENYFLDPEVLSRALTWDDARKSAYVAALERVLDGLAHVTAARIALTAHAPRRLRLETKIPIDAGDPEVRQALRARASDHNEGARIDENALIASYEACLSGCLPGGRLRAAALDVFAGKDILAKIQQTAGFHVDVKNPSVLAERVLAALGRDSAPHVWVPEWASLRSAVEAWRPPG